MGVLLRVVTVNLLNDRSRWAERRTLLARGLAALKPDLIALQEVTEPLGQSSAHWLAEELGGYSVHVCPKAGWGRSREGIALLSRLPVGRHETLDLRGQQRTAQFVRVGAGGTPVVVANTHLHWPPGIHRAQVRQVERLIAWLADRNPGAATVVCGDFNATPGSPAIARMARSFTSAHQARWGREPEYTCPTPLADRGRLRGALTGAALRLCTNRPGATWRGTLDYLFVGPPIRVTGCGVFLDQPAPHDPTLYASDHLGLAATLEIPAPGWPSSAATRSLSPRIVLGDNCDDLTPRTALRLPKSPDLVPNIFPMNSILTLLRAACLVLLAAPLLADDGGKTAGNPVFQGHYADPEGNILGNAYWIYPTYSAPYDEQVFFDAFSSPDLVNWTKHPRILDTGKVAWAKRAMWAPSVIEKGGKFFLFFGANDIQNDETVGGIGVAVADSPGGPFRDYLSKPLIGKFHHGAQPIDQFVFKDADGRHYLIYGGWRHCNIARLNDDFTGFVPFEDGTTFREITPEGYVEGPCMFIRNGKYYFMWSEGGWTGPNYSVAYAIADSPFGPFKRLAKVLKQDPAIATGAGHHSVIHVPGTDDYYAVYHRRPPGQTDANARVTCIDRMEFDQDGLIKPIRITREGVAARPLK